MWFYIFKVQRTIARQLTLLEAIGSGTYGEVWHARWRDRDVAVKVFLSHCESSWKRETEIYQTVSLRHESILGFIASDITSGTDQQTNMYIITDYHPFGSLCDFLKFHTLSADIMTNLALSASKGLSHLHTEIQGTIATGKPAMAHRDISSNNILVKANLTCCLADFGLAVRHSSETEEVDVTPNRMVGTRIYMAPEVLGDTMNFSNIGAFKMADIYSFGLVLWEMNRRCCSDDTGLCEEFQRPYLDLLPSDPSFEDVKKVVLTERKRPSIPTRWEEHEPLRTMTKVMTECWAHNPAARLTALRVQKAINKLKKSIDSQIDDMNNDNTTGRHSMILSV
ncbi:bone morphogenetic protein receptor type-1B-like [Montipora foliosa]|uniref:bone morphogenetic protein receptor type-1B-like n=1 Tax=Montipora foliosa TaxID=591990 RepID=UPI0035F180BC